MIRLQCKSQHYAWGRPGASSEVANLLEASGEAVVGDRPYAELWMGTHQNGPSTIQLTGEDLQQWLNKHPFALGAVVRGRFGSTLPFLFKVLSIDSALSIQSHPDKALAELLHAQQPEDYKDDNHKPEMAIALTEFSALCGFAQRKEIVESLRRLPELGDCLGINMDDLLNDCDYAGSQGLKNAFSKLMMLDRALVHKIVQAVVGRLSREQNTRQLCLKEKLMLQLSKQWPSDIGILAVPFLNVVNLETGQAIYLPANEPHAYLSGNVVECMATSDNVVRAGLTRKHRDTRVLCSSLSYKQGLPEIMDGDKVDDYTLVYRPPFDEFEVQHCVLTAGQTHAIRGHIGPSVVLVYHGSAQSFCESGHAHLPEVETDAHVRKGEVYFIPACSSVTLTAGSQGLQLFIAVCNRSVFVRDPPPPGSDVHEQVDQGVLLDVYAR